LAFVIGGAKVWDRSSGHGGMLRVAGGGMLLLGLALGAIAVTVGAPQLGFDSYAATIELVGGVAATAIPLGFAIHGILRALEELTSHPRNVGYGLLLLVMSAVALLAAYQLGKRPLEQLSATGGGLSASKRG
jgi:membrane protease YdiL (CAAX protease family)